MSTKEEKLKRKEEKRKEKEARKASKKAKVASNPQAAHAKKVKIYTIIGILIPIVLIAGSTIWLLVKCSG